MWEQLTETGLAFLVERARLGKVTSYTEFNATLARRTGLPEFDFERADERAGFHVLTALRLRSPSTARIPEIPVKRKLHLRVEDLSELTVDEMAQVQGGTTPFYTDGHHCFGSTLCAVTLSCNC